MSGRWDETVRTPAVAGVKGIGTCISAVRCGPTVVISNDIILCVTEEELLLGTCSDSTLLLTVKSLTESVTRMQSDQFREVIDADIGNTP